MHNRLATALAALALACTAGQARAQESWTKHSTPLVIHEVALPQGDQTARPGEPLLVQPMTSARSARLDAPAPTQMAWSTTREYPAGTKLYGVQAPDGWAFCAASVSWFADPQTICYQDMNGDGRFDRVRNSGIPFGNVPLLVHEFGPPKPIADPVPYSEIPHAEGPAIAYVVRWAPVRARTPQGRPTPPYTISWGASLRVGTRMFDLGDGPQMPLTGGGNYPPMSVLGARIRVLGVTPDGSLHYRVESVMPTQVLRITMTLTTYTYFYVY